jgi:hypothetical protein
MPLYVKTSHDPDTAFAHTVTFIRVPETRVGVPQPPAGSSGTAVSAGGGAADRDPPGAQCPDVEALFRRILAAIRRD